MKNTLKTVGFLSLATLMACQSTPVEGQSTLSNSNPQTDTIIVADAIPDPEKKKKKIKLAILLDTSSSMNGLIEQAKNQLWKIVMQLAKAKDPDGEDPEIEIALYHYGNDGLNVLDGYVQKISGFTSELDEISEQLFSLKTNGGSEYCGTVINTSLKELTWSDDQDDLQFIFIAGNEPFDQGFSDYRAACGSATRNNVVVNTIYCGDFHEGERTFWKDGAVIGQGKYMNIDHDAKILHIESPYDDKISALNQRLNDTYIPYGTKGFEKKSMQIREDANAESSSKATATSRYLSKGSKVYKNKSWDLVDKAESDDFKIEDVEEEMLPTEMKTMTKEERLTYVSTKTIERKELKKEMSELSLKRESFVNQKRNEQAGSNSQLEDVIIEAIKEQATKKNYTFHSNIN